MALQLTIACGDYDRTHPLIDGSIKPEGIELNWLVLPHLEIWTRMLNYYDFDASEISLSSYITAKTMGKPLTAIPVFPARAFRHSYIFINTKSGIREPKDLTGKRVGLGEFQQTATVWMRGMLQHEYGVNLDEIEWYLWTPHARMEMELPKRYKVKRIRCFSTASSTRSWCRACFRHCSIRRPISAGCSRMHRESKRNISNERASSPLCIPWRCVKTFGMTIHGSRAVSSRRFSAPRKTRTRD
jgi:hypothetical protein